MKANPDFSDKAKRDFQLVERAQDGDEQAFTQLLATYRDSIYFMVLKMVRNKVDAEDLTIEAFGKAFRNIEQYSPDYAFSTWLFRIASNNCIDFLRRKKIRQLNTVSTSAPRMKVQSARFLQKRQHLHSNTTLQTQRRA